MVFMKLHTFVVDFERAKACSNGICRMKQWRGRTSGMLIQGIYNEGIY